MTFKHYRHTVYCILVLIVFITMLLKSNGWDLRSSAPNRAARLPSISWLTEPQRLSDVRRQGSSVAWRLVLAGPAGSEISRVLGGGVVPGKIYKRQCLSSSAVGPICKHRKAITKIWIEGYCMQPAVWVQARWSPPEYPPSPCPAVASSAPGSRIHQWLCIIYSTSASCYSGRTWARYSNLVLVGVIPRHMIMVACLSGFKMLVHPFLYTFLDPSRIILY